MPAKVMKKQIKKNMPRPAKAVKPVKAPKLKATDVVAYLQAHPKFLETHATALAKGTKAPKKVGNVFSLHAARAGSAEGRAQTLQKRLTQLIDVAKANAQAQSEAQTAVVVVFMAQSAAELSKALLGPFRLTLGLGAARLLRVGESDSATTLAPATLAKLCPQPLTLGPIDAARHADLFGPQLTTLKSCALLRLETNGKPLGLLALGSITAGHFHAGQATDLLEFLRQVVSIKVAQLG